MHWEYSNLSFQEHGMVTLPQFDRRIFDAETLKKEKTSLLSACTSVNNFHQWSASKAWQYC